MRFTEICINKCIYRCKGTNSCCVYCKYIDVCTNSCDKNPYDCNNTIANDTELLDFALTNYINMDKVELIETYKLWKGGK